jgi:hypothetical protein
MPTEEFVRLDFFLPALRTRSELTKLLKERVSRSSLIAQLPTPPLLPLAPH